MSPAHRLKLLLPWINQEAAVNEATLKKRLQKFLWSFRGSGLQLVADTPHRDLHNAGADELEAARRRVRVLLDDPLAGHGDKRGTENITASDLAPIVNLKSLRFAAVRAAARNTFEMQVDGKLHDLVPFLMLWTLVTGQLSVLRCDGPGRGHWKKRCGNFFVQQGQGRPRVFCSDACTGRARSEREVEKQKAKKKQGKRRRRRTQ